VIGAYTTISLLGDDLMILWHFVIRDGGGRGGRGKAGEVAGLNWSKVVYRGCSEVLGWTGCLCHIRQYLRR